MTDPQHTPSAGPTPGPAPAAPSGPARRRARSFTFLVTLSLLAAILAGGFAALGTWQVYRRAWKLDLIERVDQRVHAPAVAAPGNDRWPAVNKADDEYRHVEVRGQFKHDSESFVQAVTEVGSGFWVMSPLLRDDGTTVLINRGFVSPERRDRTTRGAEPSGDVVVTGLLRITEPKGGFLRDNDPAGDRWFSRDVQAIAAARGLTNVAPYFIDAAATPPNANGERSWPIGGLTVIRFPNSHLVYALTWYGLMLMVIFAAWYVARDERRLRQQQEPLTLRANGEREDAPLSD